MLKLLQAYERGNFPKTLIQLYEIACLPKLQFPSLSLFFAHLYWFMFFLNQFCKPAHKICYNPFV